MISTLPSTPMPMISTRKQVTVHCTLTLRKEDVSVSLATSLTTITVTNSDWFISIEFDAHSNLPFCFVSALCFTDSKSDHFLLATENNKLYCLVCSFQQTNN
ncbi:hypothetical protein T4E_9148 [Trichinella pseudospiralis]|uniref:Uncharacterized protein n=1 Tax=Trichinella pseudospiralis TaxID=6337 RepID=A0A0V0YDD6_TRIPS|nr:hypothetical protein T4E_9148 [Trichinella pseudospiralis]